MSFLGGLAGLCCGEQQQSDVSPASSAILLDSVFGFRKAGGSSSSSLLLSHGLLQFPYKQMCALKYDDGLRVNIWGHTLPSFPSLSLTYLGWTAQMCVYVSPESNNLGCHRTASLQSPHLFFVCLPSLCLSYALWHFEASPVILPSLTCIQGPISPSNTLQSAHNT